MPQSERFSNQAQMQDAGGEDALSNCEGLTGCGMKF